MQTARRQSETAKHWKDSGHKTVQINVTWQQTADRKQPRRLHKAVMLHVTAHNRFKAQAML